MSKNVDGVVSNESKTSERVSVNGFPKDLWKIWNKSCGDCFQDIRWVKIWSDHLKAQAFDLLEKSQYLVIEKEEPKEEVVEEVVGENNGLGLLNPETEELENGK